MPVLRKDKYRIDPIGIHHICRYDNSQMGFSDRLKMRGISVEPHG